MLSIIVYQIAHSVFGQHTSFFSVFIIYSSQYITPTHRLRPINYTTGIYSVIVYKLYNSKNIIHNITFSFLFLQHDAHAQKIYFKMKERLDSKWN
jgi:hypothetical protein